MQLHSRYTIPLTNVSEVSFSYETKFYIVIGRPGSIKSYITHWQPLMLLISSNSALLLRSPSMPSVAAVILFFKITNHTFESLLGFKVNY